MKKFKIGVKGSIILGIVVVLVLVLAVGGNQLLLRRTMKWDLLNGHQRCQFPCWNDITPGVTTRDHAMSILRQISYIDRESIKESGTDSLGGCIWNWEVSGRRMQPTMHWQMGKISEISLGLTFDLSVKEIIDKIGVPEAIEVVNGGVPEKWYWIVKMYYASTGLEVVAYTRDFSTVLSPSTEVGGMIFFPPTSVKGRISVTYPNLQYDEIDWLYTDWKGFGDLKDLYPIHEIDSR